MSNYKFHSHTRKDHKQINLISFQGGYLLHKSDAILAALEKSEITRNRLALPLNRAPNDNRIDWYSKFKGLKPIEDFSEEEQKSIEIDFITFRDKVFEEFNQDSSLAKLFMELLPEGIGPDNDGEAYYPHIWSNGSDFTVIWGVYRSLDEIIAPKWTNIYNPDGVVENDPNDPLRHKPGLSNESRRVGRDIDTSDVEEPHRPYWLNRHSVFGNTMLWLFLCILLLIAMFFVGCPNCNDVRSPINGEIVRNPAPDILPDVPNLIPTIDPGDLVMDPLTNTWALNRINIYPKSDGVDMSDFVHDVINLCPDSTADIVYWDPLTKRIQLDYDYTSYRHMKDTLKVVLSNYDPLIWYESIFYMSQINDPIYKDSEKGWHYSAINFDETHIDISSPSVKIAIIDDGFDLNHRDLSPSIEDAYNIIERGVDVYGEEANNHGTQVSGFCFANSNNELDGCGVSSNCTFMPIQIGDPWQEGISTTAIIDAILYAINHDADIINLSIASDLSFLQDLSQAELNLFIEYNLDENFFWQELFSICEEKGVVVVKAAGNEHEDMAPIKKMVSAFSICSGFPRSSQAS